MDVNETTVSEVPVKRTRNRETTRPIPRGTGGMIEIDLSMADTEAAAQFMELVARVIRDKKRIRIIIE